jgi:hypothetical protein
MSLRYSTGLRNFLAKFGGLADALQNGQIELRTGTQPTSADAAPTGTLLCTLTDNAQARTAEVRPTGTVTLTGGAGGSVDAVTVNSVNVLGAAVPFNGTLAQTAADVAAQINRHKSSPNYEASAAGAVVTIKALPGVGTQANGYVVTATLTTVTASYANMSGGVNPVNGLKFDKSTDGEMDLYLNQIWSGVNAADGVAGWYRFTGSVADSGLVDTTATQIRLDGSVSTTGADMNLRNTTLAVSATTRITAATATVPAQ